MPLLRPLVLSVFALPLGGCAALGSIYEVTGLRGVVLIVAVLALLGFLVSRMDR